jgi:hypothetical protein
MSNVNFICPGAQKAATTTLWRLLAQHPDIFLPDLKEPHFFDRDTQWERGADWYHAEYYADAGGECIVGDVTPRYMLLPEVPGRIRKALGPGVKFVFLLRDPARRAYSHYWMHRGKGGETRSFDEAVRHELRLLDAPGATPPLEITNYVTRGFYARQIRRFEEHFPRSQMHFVLFERFVAETEQTTEEILDFLGLDSVAGMSYDKKGNPATQSRVASLISLIKRAPWRWLGEHLVPSAALRRRLADGKNALLDEIVARTSQEIQKPPMQRSTLALLKGAFERSNEELHALTGLDLAPWDTAPACLRPSAS